MYANISVKMTFSLQRRETRKGVQDKELRQAAILIVDDDISEISSVTNSSNDYKTYAFWFSIG